MPGNRRFQRVRALRHPLRLLRERRESLQQDMIDQYSRCRAGWRPDFEGNTGSLDNLQSEDRTNNDNMNLLQEPPGTILLRFYRQTATGTTNFLMTNSSDLDQSFMDSSQSGLRRSSSIFEVPDYTHANAQSSPVLGMSEGNGSGSFAGSEEQASGNVSPRIQPLSQSNGSFAGSSDYGSRASSPDLGITRIESPYNATSGDEYSQATSESSPSSEFPLFHDSQDRFARFFSDSQDDFSGAQDRHAVEYIPQTSEANDLQGTFEALPSPTRLSEMESPRQEDGFSGAQSRHFIEYSNHSLEHPSNLVGLGIDFPVDEGSLVNESNSPQDPEDSGNADRLIEIGESLRVLFSRPSDKPKEVSIGRSSIDD